MAETYLITAAKFKAYKKIASADTTNDTLIGYYVDWVTDYINKYCRREFRSTVYTNVYADGNGSEFLRCLHQPITTLTAITLDDVDIKDDVEIYDDGVALYYADGFTEGVRNVKLTYTAGYATIPMDIELAAYILIDYIYGRRDQIGVLNVSTPDGSSFGLTDLTIPPIVLETLDRYVLPCEPQSSQAGFMDVI